MSPCWNWRKCPSLLTTRLHSAVYASAGEAATSYTSVSRCSNIYIYVLQTWSSKEIERSRPSTFSPVFLTLVHPLVCFPIVSHSISHVSASKNSAWVLTNGAPGCRYLMTNFCFGRHTPGDICPFFFFFNIPGVHNTLKLWWKSDLWTNLSGNSHQSILIFCLFLRLFS